MNAEQDWRKQCEAELLALSGAIQAHGGLIYLDGQWHVTHVSENIELYIGYSPATLLDQALPEELLRELKEELSKLPADPGSRNELLEVNLVGNTMLDLVLTRSTEGILIEFFPHDGQVASTALSMGVERPQNNDQALELNIKMAEVFREITGFDRVMIYAFREDGDGEVLAESRNKAVYGSYLGLRFPGSDIPMIARTLYLKNSWRLIPDNQTKSVPLRSNRHTPPDLTWSDLRSVSPIHQIYLANMGVRASLSFPIVVVGELWGLVACHHAEPRNLPLHVLCAGSMMARQYGSAISSWQAESRLRQVDGLAHFFDSMQMMLLNYDHPLHAIVDIAPQLLEKLDACGLAMRFADDWVLFGKVIDIDTLDQLDEWFEWDYQEPVYCCENLSLAHSGTGQLPVAGAIALKLQTKSKGSLHVWIFRPEFLQVIEWGGNPEKPVEYHDGELGINPRRSFEKWLEKRFGYCRPWQNIDRLVALQLRHLLLKLYG